MLLARPTLALDPPEDPEQGRGPLRYGQQQRRASGRLQQDGRQAVESQREVLQRFRE